MTDTATSSDTKVHPGVRTPVGVGSVACGLKPKPRAIRRPPPSVELKAWIARLLVRGVRAPELVQLASYAVSVIIHQPPRSALSSRGGITRCDQ